MKRANKPTKPRRNTPLQNILNKNHSNKKNNRKKNKNFPSNINNSSNPIPNILLYLNCLRKNPSNKKKISISI